MLINTGIVLWVGGGVCLAAVALCAWLWADRNALRRRCRDLVQQRDERAMQAESYRTELASLKTDIAVAQETQRGLEAQFQAAQKQARETFESVAAKVLQQSNAQFLQLANQTLDGKQKDATAQLEKRQQAINALVKPLKESLERYGSLVQQIETSRKESYGSLAQQVQALRGDQQLLQKETANLVQSLRRPKVGGRWGEMQLKRVAELAGMIENCDFAQQVTIQTEAGRLQPDMVVTLPSNRTIVVDAKTPLEAFIAAIESEEESQRETLLQKHTQNILDQVTQLAKKSYAEPLKRSLDLVVLFIPGESFLFPAVQRRADLIETAMAKGVVIATPTTLITLLRAVALGWQEQRLTENAQKIRDLGRQLHERLCTVVEHFTSLGRSLNATVEHYNKLTRSLETRVMVSARKFEELGAKSPKAIPEDLPQIEIVAQSIKATQGNLTTTSRNEPRP